MLGRPSPLKWNIHFNRPKKYFLSMEVEEGGVGSGTIVNFTMRLLGQTQALHSIITEPETGRLLVETYLKLRSPLPSWSCRSGMAIRAG